MKLINLSITQDWSKKDQYVGHIEFDDDRGKIQLTLSDTLSRRLFDIVGDELAAQGRRMAEAMHASIKAAQTPLLSRSEQEYRQSYENVVDPTGDDTDEETPFSGNEDF
jgi:hypothetical protein